MAEPRVAHAGRRWRTGRGHAAGGHATPQVHVGARVGHHVAGRLAGGGPTGIVGSSKRGGVVMQLIHI